MNVLSIYNKKRIGIYCDDITIFQVVYTIKEKIKSKIIRTIFSKGYAQLDITTEDGNNYLVMNLSTSFQSIRGLKFDEVWYSFSNNNRDGYLYMIHAFNCHLNENKFKRYIDIKGDN